MVVQSSSDPHASRTLLEDDVRLALEAQAGRYLDLPVLLTALRERHGGELGAFVDAVDGAIDALYQQGRIGIPGMKWADDETKRPQSIRGWISSHKDAVAWNPEVSAYVWTAPQASASGLVFISSKAKPRRSGVDAAALCTCLFSFIVLSLVLWGWCKR